MGQALIMLLANDTLFNPFGTYVENTLADKRNRKLPGRAISYCHLTLTLSGAGGITSWCGTGGYRQHAIIRVHMSGVWAPNYTGTIFLVPEARAEHAHTHTHTRTHTQSGTHVCVR